MSYFQLHIVIHDDNNDEVRHGTSIYICYFLGKINGENWKNSFIKTKREILWWSSYKAKITDLYGKWGSKKMKKIFFLFKNIRITIRRYTFKNDVRILDLEILNNFILNSWQLSSKIIHRNVLYDKNEIDLLSNRASVFVKKGQIFTTYIIEMKK